MQRSTFVELKIFFPDNMGIIICTKTAKLGPSTEIIGLYFEKLKFDSISEFRRLLMAYRDTKAIGQKQIEQIKQMRFAEVEID